MTLLLPEGEERSRAAGVSRRRVLQGVAWATPAVVIATAAPALAASGPAAQPSALTATSSAAVQKLNQLTVTTIAQYVGGEPVDGYQPVASIVKKISVQTSRVGAGAPSTASAGWNYTSSSVSGSNTVFTFTWTGSPLSSANPSTASLVAVIPKTTDRTTFSVQVWGEGVSNLQAVSSVPEVLSVGAYSLLTFNSNPGGYRDTSGNPRYTHVQSAVLNSPGTNSAPVVGVVAKISMASDVAGGTGTPAVEQGAWTYVGVATVGLVTTYTFSLTAGTLATSYSPTQAYFRIPRLQSANAATPVTVRFEGRSPTAQGALTFVEGTASI